jgi:hypothetical protein
MVDASHVTCSITNCPVSPRQPATTAVRELLSWYYSCTCHVRRRPKNGGHEENSRSRHGECNGNRSTTRQFGSRA